jgi:hypothetical protein
MDVERYNNKIFRVPDWSGIICRTTISPSSHEYKAEIT